ncbi:MAG: hypothetical protein ACR2QO_17215 [Acidimicrobiales bacterium]
MTADVTAHEPAAERTPPTGRFRSLALPVVSLGLAAAAAFLVWQGASPANELDWLVGRLEAASVLVVAFGIGLRSERMVAFATAPALVGLVVGATGSIDIAWGRALIVGCLWYLAIEAALSSIEWSGGLQVSVSAIQRRMLDVATVVFIGASIGVLGVAVAGWAPDRTIVARAIVLVAVLAALVFGVRHLATVDRPSDPS